MECRNYRYTTTTQLVKAQDEKESRKLCFRAFKNKREEGEYERDKLFNRLLVTERMETQAI